MFKIKDGYKLELQTSETIKVFGSIGKLIGKTKNGENVPSLEVVELVLVQSNLVDDQYQQKSEVLCTFTPNKSSTYLLNVEPSNSVFLKTHNTDFVEVVIQLTGQIRRPLEIEVRVNLKNEKICQAYGFVSFARIVSSKYGKQLLDTATKTGLDALRIASKKVVHKASEASGEFIGNKIADKIVKPKPVPNANLRNVEEIVILPEKREEILDDIRQVL